MSFFERFSMFLQTSAFSQAMRDSVWKFAVAQAIHLCFISVLIGALLIVDLRMLGRGLKQQSTAQVTRDAQPWLIWGLVGTFITGMIQFATNAHSRYYDSPVFRWKMGLLLFSLVFTFTLRRWIALRDESRTSPILTKSVAIASIVLWTGVAVGGRMIGFF